MEPISKAATQDQAITQPPLGLTDYLCWFILLSLHRQTDDLNQGWTFGAINCLNNEPSRAHIWAKETSVSHLFQYF